MDVNVLSNVIFSTIHAMRRQNKDLSLSLLHFGQTYKLIQNVKPEHKAIMSKLRTANVGYSTEFRKAVRFIRSKKIRFTAVVIISDYEFYEYARGEFEKEIRSTFKNTPILHIGVDTDQIILKEHIRQLGIRKTKNQLICLLAEDSTGKI